MLLQTELLIFLLHFLNNLKLNKMKQSTKDAITVTIIIILALLGDSIFNQI